MEEKKTNLPEGVRALNDSDLSEVVGGSMNFDGLLDILSGLKESFTDFIDDIGGLIEAVKLGDMEMFGKRARGIAAGESEFSGVIRTIFNNFL